jgi:glucose-6-phosphate isomerase
MTVTLSFSGLGPLSANVEMARDSLRNQRVAQRIIERDHTVWKADPTEISNRLGWMDSPTAMLAQLQGIDNVVDDLRADGVTHALLLGMGGSSLAPEVFRRLFGVAPGYLDLSVLDSTDPETVSRATGGLNPARTLFVPATKSGGTVETLSFTKYCYGLVVAAVGRQQAGRQFVAITDPGSGLTDLADHLDFRHTFLNDPNIGGRYSALSCFGIFPARLGGVDVQRLLASGGDAASDITDDGIGVRLGAAIGAAAHAGRDKLTLITSPSLAPLGVWIEQLIAESTGKEGKGILPVDGEPTGSPDVYGDDRLFIRLRQVGEPCDGDAVDALVTAGHPVVDLQIEDIYDVGGLVFAWEVATLIASHLMRINPFDQPDVDAAKILARSMIDEYRSEGRLPSLTPALEVEGISVYGDIAANTLAGVIRQFLGSAANNAYLTLQAYLPSGASTDASLSNIRRHVRDVLHLATTTGYGPRFLHSTGQLHKGDGGQGLFLQITCESTADLSIPDEPGGPTSAVSFGTLKAAQALGDRQALLHGGRRVLRLHLGADVAVGLKTIESALRSAIH